MLCHHFTDFFNQAEYIHISSPLILAIRALVSKSETLKNQFFQAPNMIDILIDISVRSYGNSRVKNINISTNILMCEGSFEVILPINLRLTNQRQMG
jgi:hypothetical protein